MRTLAIVSTLLLTSCGGASDLLKDIESGAYDAAAVQISEHCQRTRGKSLFLQRTMIEARREIRQRGYGGPSGPLVPVEGLDDKTAYGDGPVVLIVCAGETDGQGRKFTVPRQAWINMTRDWRD